MSCRLPIGLVLLSALSAHAAAMHMPVSDIDPKSGIEINVESAFDKLPPCGYAPLRLVIDNNSSQAGSWNFFFSSSSTYDNSRTFRSQLRGVVVAGKAQRIVEVMVPIMTESGTYAYPRMTTKAVGPGCGANALAAPQIAANSRMNMAWRSAEPAP